MWLLVSLLGKYIFANLGLEIGYHRLISHRSFKTSKLIENILIFLGIYGGFGSSLTWAAAHRMHHKYSDKDGDPHPSAKPLTTWFWIDTYKDAKINPSAIKDLLRNPFHKWTRENYFYIWYITLALSALLLGPKFTLYFFILVGASGMFSGGMLNIVCHKFGYRNFDTSDVSTNNWWVNLYATFGGSGWHNNHHANPGSYTTKVKWWEWDLDGLVIKHFLMRNV
jgi:stearoyl-CoA desaturase (delta-9 desaturase)